MVIYSFTSKAVLPNCSEGRMWRDYIDDRPRKGSLLEKLEDYDDVFADIFNVLVFHGEDRILVSELRTGMSRSGYQVDGQFVFQIDGIRKQ